MQGMWRLVKQPPKWNSLQEEKLNNCPIVLEGRRSYSIMDTVWNSDIMTVHSASFVKFP